MNKMIIFISLAISAVLIQRGVSIQVKVDALKTETSGIQSTNLGMKEAIRTKESLPKQAAVPISTEYGVVLNEIRSLENFSGTSMKVQLEGSIDSQDISSHFEDTFYKGVRGLRIQIVVDKFSKETDMGAVLDDIHLLEKNTDFMATEISMDNNNLIVKGEVYGI